MLIWMKKGVWTIGEIKNNQGEFLSLDDIKTKFDININFLEYYAIK